MPIPICSICRNPVETNAVLTFKCDASMHCNCIYPCLSEPAVSVPLTKEFEGKLLVPSYHTITADMAHKDDWLSMK